jgi:hypothetical protein
MRIGNLEAFPELLHAERRRRSSAFATRDYQKMMYAGSYCPWSVIAVTLPLLFGGRFGQPISGK